MWRPRTTPRFTAYSNNSSAESMSCAEMAQSVKRRICVRRPRLFGDLGDRLQETIDLKLGIVVNQPDPLGGRNLQAAKRLDGVVVAGPGTDAAFGQPPRAVVWVKAIDQK